jgi:ribonucleoside-diphosphate reductase beta chain
MSVFNKNNDGHKSKSYPLFFGQDLGLFDTVNVAYPELEELYQQQLVQIWNEFEIDLSQDKMDMRELPAGVVDLMVKTISWQHLADSIACKSIVALLVPFCTNSELEGLLTIQTFFEIIHSRTYSHIVKQTFTNPNDMLERTYNDMNVLMRSNVVANTFEELENLPKDASLYQKKCALFKVMCALYALEGISFMSSFAVTFAISETDVFQGIASLVSLICRDEVLHTRMDATIIDILLRDEEWKTILEENKSDIKAIIDEVVKQELDWADHLFSEGRQLVGLNANLLKEYTQFMAAPIYDHLGINYDFHKVEKTPLPYMSKYIDPSKMQSAAQEIQLTSYQVGATIDDTKDLDLTDLSDFDF